MKLTDKLRPLASVTGPYTRPDGRKHVSVRNGDKKSTVSYPKWLIEQHLGRFLAPDETVDHKDRDFTNDSLENLQILARSVHSTLDASRCVEKVLLCVWCGQSFLVKSLRDRDRGKAGPFCSKSCCGSYGVSLQNKRVEKMAVSTPVREYEKRTK